MTSAADSPRRRPSRRRLAFEWIAKITLGIIVIGLLIVAAAAMAGPVHRALIDVGWMAGEPHAERLDGFLKVFRRLMVILLVGAALLYFRPWRGMQRGGHDYGLTGDRARARPALIAWVATVAVIAGLLAWQMAQGWVTWEDPLDGGKAAKRFGRVFLTPALLVALFEEFVFRGWLQTSVQSVMRPFRAALVVSLIYAFLHAFRPSSSVINVTFDTAGALEAFQSWLAYAVDPAGFGPAFVGLFLFGMLLTAAYLRTGTLWTAIAVHMAGIWMIYSYGSVTDRDPARTWAGGKLLYDGLLGWLLLLLPALLLWPRKRSLLR